MFTFRALARLITCTIFFMHLVCSVVYIAELRVACIGLLNFYEVKMVKAKMQ